MSDVPAARDPKRLTRRQLLIAAAAGTATVATGGTAAFLATRGSGDDPTPAADVTPTPTNIPTPPTRTPSPREGEIVARVPDAFEHREFAPGELIDWPQGIFFMDVSSGAITGYRLRSGESGGPMVGGEGRFVGWDGSFAFDSFLLDRTTGDCWRWDGKAHRLKAATPTRFLLSTAQPGAPARETSDFPLIDAASGAIRKLTLAAKGASHWRTHGELAAVVPDETSGEVLFINLDTDDRTIVTAVADPEVGEKRLTHLGIDHEGAGGLQFFAIYEPPGEPGASPASYSLIRVGWDGPVRRGPVGEGIPFESESLDGRYFVRTQTCLERRPPGLEESEAWTAAVLHNSAGDPVYRVRSASLRYGDGLPNLRWLADSSGFVAAINNGEPYNRANGPHRYALFSPEGEMTLLPTPPVTAPDWYTASNIMGPAPSPSNPDLVSFGRFYLYNRRTAQWLMPNLGKNEGPAHLAPDDSPWAAGANEMVFALPHGGHDGGSPAALVAPFVERAPFKDVPAMRFHVSGTGSCLNVRAGPATTAESLACLLDGTSIELDPDGESLREGGPKLSHTFREGGPWALVRGPGGVRGWVSTAFLAWDK